MNHDTIRLFPLLRNLHLPLVGNALLALAAGCGGFELPDGDGSGGSGGPTPEFCVGGCNGVYVACANPGSIPPLNPGGADGGSGDSGGGSGSPPDNWYWEQCPLGVSLPNNTGCEPSDEYCCTPGFGTCYCRVYDNSGLSTPQSIGNVCVGNGAPPSLDPINDWNSGGYPGFESPIQAMCETKCLGLTVNQTGLSPSCDAASWGIPITVGAWQPSDGENCSVAEELNVGDPYGIGVPWSSVGGGSTALPLGCDLTGDCGDAFFPNLTPYVTQATESAPIAPETRGAHYLAGSNPTARPEFYVSVDYAGTRYDETNPIYGLLEYSHDDCGGSVCPFFLANVTASNTTDTWTVPVKLDTGSVVTRTFSDLQINLLQSTLGIENSGLGKVAFAPGALRMAVEFKVHGSGYGSGDHSFVVENDVYVFADVTATGLDLDYSFALQSLGTATLRLPVDVDEGPPTATHDIVTTTASCSYTVSSASRQSTDPDNDIEDEYWVVDGEICGESCTLGPGSHDIELVAVDARGAVDMTDVHTISISGC